MMNTFKLNGYKTRYYLYWLHNYYYCKVNTTWKWNVQETLQLMSTRGLEQTEYCGRKLKFVAWLNVVSGNTLLLCCILGLIVLIFIFHTHSSCLTSFIFCIYRYVFKTCTYIYPSHITINFGSLTYHYLTCFIVRIYNTI